MPATRRKLQIFYEGNPDANILARLSRFNRRGFVEHRRAFYQDDKP